MAPAAPAEEPPAKEDHDFWTDFVEAEECADGGFDAILTACGDALYAKYLSDKAFKFAAQTATDIMVAHLRMSRRAAAGRAQLRALKESFYWPNADSGGTGTDP